MLGAGPAAAGVREVHGLAVARRLTKALWVPVYNDPARGAALAAVLRRAGAVRAGLMALLVSRCAPLPPPGSACGL